MTPFRNHAISASAGTGKTFRLAHRFLGLMASNVSPDRICALTFSRKAAGEIFDKIVEHLCGAATDAGQRERTARTIRQEGLRPPPDRPDAYLQLLRKLLDHEHRLRIGTLDSFILGVVRAFPLELGISPQAQPIQGEGGEALALRQDLLVRLFDPSGRPVTDVNSEGDAFLRAFRQACFGQETKALVSVLDRFISEHYGFYRQHNTAAWRWGNRERIWAASECWWIDPARPKPVPFPSDLAARLSAAFGGAERDAKLARECAAIIDAACAFAPDRPWPKFSGTIFPQLVALARQAEVAALRYYKKEYPIPGDVRPVLRAALSHLIDTEIGRALERTRGLRAVLDRYDQLYAEALHSGGRLTFEDLSRLLGAGGLSPSRSKTAHPNRLYIDYRLDGELDHWLLDEFQDTSDTQWEALKNLIDEVIQDDNRSFFYVGDVKQSVYGWRGGNYRLFGQLLRQYAQAGDRALGAESMAECHRSLPAVIAAVNAVFDRLPEWEPAAGAEQGPRRAAVEAFSAVWQRHESARKNEGAGFAALLEYEPLKSGGDGDEEESDDPAEFEAVAKILRETQPTRSGLTAAVLVRSNKAGRACVDVLRRRLPSVPVVHEGTGGIVDNPVVTLLLALVRYAAHPGDTVAGRHLQMSPLARSAHWPDLDRLPDLVLREVQDRGYAETLRGWGERMGPLDAFGRQRLRELLAAAEQFDATGSRSPDAFADHIQAYTVKSGAAAGAVRVMTIHQAKGLGFDLVIVPFSPKSRSFEKPGDPKLLAGADWVLDPPGGQAFEAAAGAPLAALETVRADANFAQLCVLYVALTRAQQALYLAIPAKTSDSAVVRETDLLRERLAPAADSDAGRAPEGRYAGLPVLYSVGDRAWHFKPGRGGSSPAATANAPVRITYAPEIPRREPSKDQAETFSLPAHWLFGSEAGDVLAFGSAIHRLFEKIEWLETADLERLIADWRAESSEPMSFLADVERQFRACLTQPEVRRKLARPADAAVCEVWREAAFGLIMEAGGRKHLMSGRFDRLVVERDRSGKPGRATIFDFKSNRVERDSEVRAAAEGYAAQMADYARAAARLLGLPVERVETVLLFTRTGRLWTA